MRRAFVPGLLAGLVLGGFVGFVAGRSAPPAGEGPRADGETAAIPADDAPTRPPSGRSGATAAPRPRVATAPDPGDAAPSSAPPERPSAPATAPPRPANGASTSPYAGWTAARFLELFERGARAGNHLDLRPATDALEREQPDLRVPPALVIGMARNCRDANWIKLMRTMTDADVRELLRHGLAAGPDDLVAQRLTHPAASCAGGLDVEEATIRQYVTHPDPRFRRVGLRLARQRLDAWRDALLEMAGRDPEEGLRSKALETIVHAESERGEPTDASFALLSAALRTRDIDLQRGVGHLLPEFGARGGRLALDYLADTGYAPHPDLERELVFAVLEAGLAPRLIAGSNDPDMLRLIAVELEADDEDEVRNVVALAPHYDAMAAVVTGDARWRFYLALANAGQAAFLEHEILGDARPPEARSIAYACLLEATNEGRIPPETLFDVAEQVVWIDALPTDTRLGAIEDLAAHEQGRRRAYDIQLRVLRDGTTPAVLRADTLSQITDGWEGEELRAHWPEILEAWRRVAAEDPVPWVRAAATELLKDAEPE